MLTSRTLVASGTYAIFHAGQPCGEERWQLESGPDGLVASGEQVLAAPHPFPNRHEYRVALTRGWRVTALDVRWAVGDRRLAATHRADGPRWHGRIETAGHAREQQGDYPEYCEVEYPSHLFNGFVLAKREFATLGEHEFPVLRIGPPMMAVSPGRMRYRCVEAGRFEAAGMARDAKRYVLSLPPEPETSGYTFWADAHDIVLASFEGLDLARPWMTLVEYRRP